MLQKVSPSCRGKNIEALVQCSGGDCLPDWGRGCVYFVALRRLLRRSLGVRSYVASLTFSQAVFTAMCLNVGFVLKVSGSFLLFHDTKLQEKTIRPKWFVHYKTVF